MSNKKRHFIRCPFCFVIIEIQVFVWYTYSKNNYGKWGFIMAKKKSWLTGSAIGSSGIFGGNSGGGRFTSTSSGWSAWDSISGALGNITDKIKDAASKVPGGTEEVDPIAQKVKDYADLLNKYGLGPGGGSGSSSSSSGGGYAAPNRIDIQPMIDAFTNAANAQKNTLQTTANQQRSELLNSIKRFQ